MNAADQTPPMPTADCHTLNLSGAFDLDTARALCAACANTYFSECDISTPLCHATVKRLGATELQVAGCKLQVEQQNEKPSTFNLYPVTRGEPSTSYTLIAFRGSKSLRDWLTDFQFRRVRADSGDLVHEGFYRAWLSVRDLLPESPALRNSDTPLVITGHSLGGAMALLAAEGLFKRGFPIAAVYTFGGPRVGDGAWAMGYDIVLKTRTWRLVDELDLVPRVPFLGFMHGGNRVQLADNGLFVNPPLWQLLGQDALQMYRAWRARRVEQLTDHPIIAYTSRLSSYLPTQVF